jgi:hypothetical protein
MQIAKISRLPASAFGRGRDLIDWARENMAAELEADPALAQYVHDVAATPEDEWVED